MPLLKILSNSERLRFDTPPVFDSEERKRCFNLPRTLESSLENLRSAENQILFILQFGYFRCRQRFFAGHFHLADLEYVSAKFDIPIRNVENLSYSRSSILRQQYIILNYFGVRVISKSDEITLLGEATELVKTVVRPVKIFWQLVEKITNLKMVVPTHHWLTNLISKAIQIHEKELVSIIEESLSNEQKVLLDSLLSSDENDSESVPDVNLASHKYRSLNDYLIPKAVWKNKSPELLRKSDLESFTEPHEILHNLTKQTANAFRRTNRNLSVNEYFKSKEKGSWTISTPKEDGEFALPLRNYFPKRQITPLSEVLATVGQATDFLDEFTHLQTVGNRRKPPNLGYSRDNAKNRNFRLTMLSFTPFVQ